ncbi:hypothetical protein FOL47_001102 [Perkinsus chesapeaki]|uniref:Uncharacterized protein n=1 Tax=Perkinsus chesapeaki TaxID=330153 RepID=A0A7J6KTI9_PERCH|nr:hypothetical protein FOL47_001102 [Perkinsus chesapeaki]
MSFPTTFFVGNIPTSVDVVPAPDLVHGPRRWLATTRPHWSYFISSSYQTDPEKFHLYQDLVVPQARGYVRGTVYCNVAVMYRSGLEKGLWDWLNKQPIPRKERKEKEAFVRAVIDDAIWPVIDICGSTPGPCPYEHDIAHMGQKFWSMLESDGNEVPSNFVNYDDSNYRIPYSDPGLIYDPLSGFPVEEAFPLGEMADLDSEESLNRLYFMGAQLLWGRSAFEHVPHVLLENFLKRWVPVDRALQGAFIFAADLNLGCFSHGLNLGRRYRKSGSATESAIHFCGDQWSYLFSDVMFSDLYIAVGCGEKGKFYSALNDTYVLMASLLPRSMGLSPSMSYLLHKASFGTATDTDYEIIGDFFEFLFGILVLQGSGDIISLMVSALVLIQGVKNSTKELQLAVLPDFSVDIEDLRVPAQRLGLSPPTSSLKNYVLGLRSSAKPQGWKRLSALGSKSYSSFYSFDWRTCGHPDHRVYSLFRRMKNFRGYILYFDGSTVKDRPTEGRHRRRIRESDFRKVIDSSLAKFVHSKECRQLMKRFFPTFASNVDISDTIQP